MLMTSATSHFQAQMGNQVDRLRITLRASLASQLPATVIVPAHPLDFGQFCGRQPAQRRFRL